MGAVYFSASRQSKKIIIKPFTSYSVKGEIKTINHMFRRILTLLPVLLAISSFNLLAQNQNLSPDQLTQNRQQRRTKNTLTFMLQDASNSLPVSFATAYVTKDTTLNNPIYSLSDVDGNAVMENVPTGQMYLTVELMGYIKVQNRVNIEEGNNDLGVIFMKPDVQRLDESVVTAIGNPIVVKKDTIEYTASSFKTGENDMLEELLKKLPGVEVSEDGTITANGEEITKITIGGKTFFLDDPQLALKNIPARIVEKVKVVEKKSDQAEFTGIDDGESEKVIDLSINPGMMDGWFGSIGGGAGNDITQNDPDTRFEGATMIGHFSDDLQVSILGNANNTNNRGFNDMTSNMMSTMRASIGGRGQGGSTSGNNGITTSWMGGTNIMANLLDDKMELGGNYLYSGSDKDIQSQTSETTFLTENENLYTQTESQELSTTQGHRASLELDYKLSDKTSILFRPDFNYGIGKYSDQSTYSTDKTFNDGSSAESLNDGMSKSDGESNTLSTAGTILFRQKLGDTPGRTISLYSRYSFSQSNLDAYNYSLTNENNEGESRSSIIDQNYLLDQQDYSVNSRLTYTEPLGNNYFLEASYRFSWRENNSVKNTYNLNSLTGEYDILDALYSTNYSNTFMNHDMRINAIKQEEKYTIQIGASAQPATTISTQRVDKVDSTTEYTVWNFAPSARIDFNFSDNSFLRLRYNGRTNQPSITQLQPVPDNTNPLYIQLGNPNLLPEFRHDLFAMHSYTNKETFFSVYSRLGASYVKDPIVNARWYDDTGVQSTAPVNANGDSYNTYAYVTLNTPIAKSKFSISSSTSSSISSSLNYTGIGNEDNLEDIFSSLELERTTNLNVSENLKFTYRNNLVEASIAGIVRYQNSYYSFDSNQLTSTWTNTARASVILSLPFGLEFKTNADYNFYVGYEDGFGDRQIIWNAELTQLLFKKKASLSLKVYDILDQANSVYRVNGDNFTRDVITNSLGRYFTLSFIYRFGEQKQAPQKSRYGGGGYHLRRG